MEMEYPSLCPACEGCCRHFHTLADQSIILYCEECDAIWTNPEDISVEKMSSMEADDLRDNDQMLHWSTTAEVNNSLWAGNIVFGHVKKIHHNLLMKYEGKDFKRERFSWDQVCVSPEILAGNGYYQLLEEYLEELDPSNLEFELHVNQVNRLKKYYILKNSVIGGHLHIVQYMIEQYKVDSGVLIGTVATAKKEDLMYFASKYGWIDIIVYLLGLTDEDSLPIRWNFNRAIGVAPLSNNFDLLKLLVNRARGKAAFDTYSVYESAARVARIDMLEWLDTTNRSAERHRSNLYQQAIATNNLEILEYFKSKNDRHTDDKYKLYDTAALYGSLAILNWLKLNNIGEVSRMAYSNAAYKDFVEIIHWLYTNTTVQYSSYALENAIIGGSLESLIFLKKHLVKESAQVSNFIDLATEYSNLEIVKWLYENHTDVHSNTIDKAASCGSLEIVEWLDENTTKGCTTLAMDMASANGHLDIVKYLHVNRTEGATFQAMNAAASVGNLEVVRWLNENRTEGCTTQAFVLAAQNGHLDVIRYLHYNRTEGGTLSTIDNAAYGGHLNVISWISEARRKDECSTLAMSNAALNGHLKLVRWLHNNRTEGCKSKSMDKAAEAGFLDIVKWLHYNRTEGCSKAAIDKASQNGHIETVKWLHYNRTEGCTKFAIDSASIAGHLQVVKFLSKNRTEGCSSNARKNAERNGHLEVALFLKTNRSECFY
ncbi:hypothetical protein PPL_05450 [Heterostelium album PN500]|uniref:Ankyrin repeat protein n=1 Tax=Heterostelium pallidum (strain ATCC 26659 / Pp 5 / PN500) TaxID=670386 RepID=D3BA75_HETP5|nr:hypothetical protein PPL_05450 [Heterostelium album PN500]EFA81462.1 hypothetical protein PPL_05450 [Heterostelium album PN500]|eukprot:XP_020433580.1 hypothetical protein PPL_05450 [Heterostelium album PN500]